MALLAAALLVPIFALLRRDDDVLVDHTQPGAGPRSTRRATSSRASSSTSAATRDDAHKWEVTLRANGTDYEVELEPSTLALLRIDYD